MRRSFRWLLWCPAALLLAVSGCASGVPDEVLPDQPLAVLHWERDAFRKRLEILEGNPGPEGPRREGVANLQDVGKWLGAISGAAVDRELSRYPGYLSLYDPRSGELTRIEAALPGSRPLAWSQDHRRLLFASSGGDRLYQIREYDLDSGEVRVSTPRSGETQVAADYGPDGQIVFGGIDLSGERAFGRIYTALRPGAAPDVITEGALAESVRWSPQGEQIVFVIRHRARTLGGEARPLLLRQPVTEGARATMLGAGRQPIFTPDGEWLVYSAPVQRGWKLRRIRLDGSARSSMGDSIRDELSPAVSPDGAFVAYVARVAGLDRMFLRRMDGSGDRVLPGDGSFAYPVW